MASRLWIGAMVGGVVALVLGAANDAPLLLWTGVVVALFAGFFLWTERVRSP